MIKKPAINFSFDGPPPATIDEALLDTIVNDAFDEAAYGFADGVL